MQAIVVPVRYMGNTNCSLSLIDISSAITYESKLKSNKDKSVQLVTVNTYGMKPREKYRFRLTSDCKNYVFVGKFNSSGDVMSYPYFLKPDVN